MIKGNAQAYSLALLEDRVALRQGKRQIYGSQIHSDKETGEMFVAPLIDPENIDKRRAEVGLGKLDEYVGNWKLTWDVEMRPQTADQDKLDEGVRIRLTKLEKRLLLKRSQQEGYRTISDFCRAKLIKKREIRKV